MNKEFSTKKNLQFQEIRGNRFGRRRWAIKQNGKIIRQGYNFVFGMKLFEKLKYNNGGLVA